MDPHLTLASASAIRCSLLQNAGVRVQVEPARIDEQSIKAALIAEGTRPRDIADYLAEAKARKASGKATTPLVLGCDQVLELDGTLLSKAKSPAEARDQLMALRGQTHKLFTAAVLYDQQKPVWRHVSEVRLKMRLFSEDYLDDYLARNWDDVQYCVGAYMLEKEGARLMSRVEGDAFAVLGLPLLEVLNHLTVTGVIDG